MKLIFSSFIFLFSFSLHAQEKVNPVIKSFGGIYQVPAATVTPAATLKYKMVVDVVSGNDDPEKMGRGFYLVSRMMNLFAVGGVPQDSLEVVLAIHGGATAGVMDNDSYRARYGVDNPNLEVIKELKEAGVKLTVCGQSLIGREVAMDAVNPEVEIATSMLTTMAMYQMLGYGVVKF